MTDTTTPVLVGLGQHSERIGEPSYEALSPADLAARAASAALADAGVLPDRVQVLACPRQFDDTFPGMPAMLGRPESFPRAVASRIGVADAVTISSVSGGQSPQQLVTELAGRIAAGELDVAMVVNSEAISTVLHLASQPDPPDFTEANGPDPVTATNSSSRSSRAARSSTVWPTRPPSTRSSRTPAGSASA